ncbi:exopolyphosphatase PRUNE1 isoform X1 [Diachasma alloeum]|uniref:exopolyphosphatase PRUNE1 isoform X1 n=1 Tax=Diachasma alloeum TaxID=454923 RepID=UPI0007384D76|nr:exopolyphosphatase PRUNE1 isoform X1 [Diachasma alloeum]
MEDFLVTSRHALKNLDKYEKIRVILGNESCDLDSAVCSLVLGLFHYSMLEKADTKNAGVIPLLNIPKREFKIKTEVVFHLQHHGIQLEHLSFRDEIELKNLSNEKKLELCLVDHHTLNEHDASLADSVVQVIDHRPQDPNWLWTGRDINLEKVGSCATLVARRIFEEKPDILNAQISNLLQGPILVDTCNFSAEAGRATPLDIEIMEKLESLRQEKATKTRDEIHSLILDAKTDISSLSPEDLLIKDLKYVNGIPIPGFPILVEEFLNLNRALDAVNSFTSERECRITILLGMDFKRDVVKRDLAVFSFLPNELENRIRLALEQSDLDLQQVSEKSKENWCLRLYKQGGVRATRKQIVPIIQSATASQC